MVSELWANFRYSNYWYLFLIILVFAVTLLLNYTKKQSESNYKRTSKIIIFSLYIPLVVFSLTIGLSIFFFGLSGDLVSDYTGILLFIGPIFIFVLIMYAMRKEKSKNSEGKKGTKRGQTSFNKGK